MMEAGDINSHVIQMLFDVLAMNVPGTTDKHSRGALVCTLLNAHTQIHTHIHTHTHSELTTTHSSHTLIVAASPSQKVIIGMAARGNPNIVKDNTALLVSVGLGELECLLANRLTITSQNYQQITQIRKLILID